MRTSCDQYKLPDGSIINVDSFIPPPVGSTLWNGYNYDLQEWWTNGKKHVETEEEKARIEAKIAELKAKYGEQAFA